MKVEPVFVLARGTRGRFRPSEIIGVRDLYVTQSRIVAKCCPTRPQKRLDVRATAACNPHGTSRRRKLPRSSQNGCSLMAILCAVGHLQRQAEKRIPDLPLVKVYAHPALLEFGISYAGQPAAATRIPSREYVLSVRRLVYWHCLAWRLKNLTQARAF
jgi:hypothetical protein